MSIIPLRYNIQRYTCSAYFIMSFESPGHNTLIDVGSDGYIIDELLNLVPQNVNQQVNQVILTHNHSDHAGGISEIKARFNSKVYAFAPHSEVDYLLRDEEKIQCGEQIFHVLHTPGHSEDSICLYCPETGAIFCGDTTLNILSPSSSYSYSFLNSLERISQLDVTAIYPGHGRPIISECNERIRQSLEYVRNSILY